MKLIVARSASIIDTVLRIIYKVSFLTVFGVFAEITVFTMMAVVTVIVMRVHRDDRDDSVRRGGRFDRDERTPCSSL